ncbi:MAG: QueT transporter family protein [Limnochordia bacterium]
MKLAWSALIAAVYVILVWIFAPISFGLVQFRIAEALTVLPILMPEAVLGLFVGAMLSNILGGLGPWDIFGGSGVTLLAAYLTRRFRHSWLAYAWPILCNAFLVSGYLHRILGVPYWLTVLSVGFGEAVVVLALGIPLIRLLRTRFKHLLPDD